MIFIKSSSVFAFETPSFLSPPVGLRHVLNLRNVQTLKHFLSMLQILVLCLNGKARWCEKGKLLQCWDSKHVTCCKKRRSRKKERMRAKAGTRLKTLEQSWPVRIVLSLETLLTDDTPLVKQQWRPDHMSSKIILAKINDTIEMEKVKMCVCVVLS